MLECCKFFLIHRFNQCLVSVLLQRALLIPSTLGHKFLLIINHFLILGSLRWQGFCLLNSIYFNAMLFNGLLDELVLLFLLRDRLFVKFRRLILFGHYNHLREAILKVIQICCFYEFLEISLMIC